MTFPYMNIVLFAYICVPLLLFKKFILCNYIYIYICIYIYTDVPYIYGIGMQMPTEPRGIGSQ